MKVLGQTADLLPSLIRYVECKCLLGGVTTSQGIELFSNHGGRRFYRGVVRNVEQTDDPDLPEAKAKIADIDASDARPFPGPTEATVLFPPAPERGDQRVGARALPGAQNRRDRLGDHAGAGRDPLRGPAQPDDFEVFGARKGSMVWSPLSNLLLYGATANVRAARASGVRIALGSDWSPTGSKNLLGELKVAWLASLNDGNSFRQRDIVAMATREAAAVLGWGDVLGSIQPGKRADLLVVDGEAGDPYAGLLKAGEASIRLVLINGVPRFGHKRLMKSLGAAGEALSVGGKARLVNLEHPGADPIVGAITLSGASETLADALRRLPTLARDLEAGRSGVRATSRGGPPTWFLVLDELAETGIELRPRLPAPGSHRRTGPSIQNRRAAVPFSSIAEPMTLDPLTVADDEEFLDRIEGQAVLPEFVRTGLRGMFP